MVKLEELHDSEKLALLAYRLYGKGPFSFHQLRRMYVASPCFGEDDWYAKSVAYTVTLAIGVFMGVFEERNGKFYVSKDYIEKFKNVDVDASVCLPQEK